MLDDVKHELVIQQSDEMEASKTGGAAESQVSDDHTGVETPPEEELPGGLDVVLLGETGVEDGVDHPLKPAGPALQAGLLLQGGFEALLQPGDSGQVAATDPAGLLLHVGEVHPVEVSQHLRDLLLVLENCPGRLGQVIQTRVPPDNYLSLNNFF